MLKNKIQFLLLSCLLIILFLLLINLQIPGLNNQALTGDILPESSSTGSSSYLAAERDGDSSTRATSGKESSEKAAAAYIVDSGDTLWKIARQWGCNSHDTRELVYRIMEYNEMTRADLTPGDRLLIPPDFN